MKQFKIILLTIVAIAFSFQSATAQSAPTTFRDEFMGQFNYSAERLLSLAEATPQEKFAWRTAEGVMSIEQVYMHIARYNYYYPASSLGIKAPEGIDVANMEKITGKAQVVNHLRRSLEHVRQAVKQMPESKLNESAKLYGRQTSGRAVLLQLITHMNEHVGQSIAYARMNGIVPPWSK